jgi:hypothetical protein
MKHGNCWRISKLPALNLYYCGNMRWFSWWRLFVVFERKKYLNPGDAGYEQMLEGFHEHVKRRNARTSVHSVRSVVKS